MNVRWLPLAGVLAGVAVITVGVGCLYMVMRTVGLENGGSCVSGGPYEIAPGHECKDGVFGLAYGGAFGLIAGFVLFLWSAHRYGGPLVVTSMAGFSWSAFWLGLGGNFLSVASELPAASDTRSEFNTVGIMFVVMGAIGLALAFGPIPYSMLSRPLGYPKPTLTAWAAWLAAVAGGFAAGFLILEFGIGAFD